ncbi:MAG: hypothetical protein IJ222_10145 [Bacteroidales bacterium]|nr:hypothetical protein [Bacteroidales bacterium]
MVKKTNFGTEQKYSAPSCEVLGVKVESAILETSFTSGSIDDGTIEDWGTL